jgi:hypothetical protein
MSAGSISAKMGGGCIGLCPRAALSTIAQLVDNKTAGAGGGMTKQQTEWQRRGVDANPQMETNSIWKWGLPIWEYLSLPVHFRTVITIYGNGDPRMEKW